MRVKSSYTNIFKCADIFNNNTQVSFVRNIVWTLSNLCRNKNPPPNFDTVKTALPALNRLLTNQDKDILGEMLSYIFFLLYYITISHFIIYIPIPTIWMEY